MIQGHNKKELNNARKGMQESVKAVEMITKLLPAGITNKVARRAGSQMESSGEEVGSQAALYGISASFDNRKNVQRLVENLLDGMY